MKSWLKLLIALIIPQLVAASGAYFTVTGNGSWYQALEKPSWNPPNGVFGPVWTTLYVLMGIALYLVWKSNAPDKHKRWAISFWGIQLFLNLLWSYLFFGQEQILGALLEMIILWLFILFTIFAFARINKLAAWLLVPYISWVSFAAILNYTIWDLNR
ncbi:TspO/MBR family protein [Flavisolibacter tropicus]|uniref:TspO and MBR n=1 Tax=Flavisolibacter tropicus TaxID=1492898 RepID=A0A172U213_9BACT|nr:TspO/MBR family protein [Flavisolibacter tropicus]ANE53154.1 TspO and MBR [Flavisolibacter tropicus]